MYLFTVVHHSLFTYILLGCSMYQTYVHNFTAHGYNLFGVYNVPMYTILLFTWTLLSVCSGYLCSLNTEWLLNSLLGWWRLTYSYLQMCFFNALFKCCMFSAFMFNLRFLCVFCLFVHKLIRLYFIMNFSDVQFFYLTFCSSGTSVFRELFFTSIQIFFCVYDKMHAGWNEMLGGGGGGS